MKIVLEKLFSLEPASAEPTLSRLSYATIFSPAAFPESEPFGTEYITR